MQTTAAPPVAASRTHAGIDLMKFLAAVLVVSIHTRPFYEIHSGLGFAVENILTRIAVPFFFICSGYFFAEKVIQTPQVKEKRRLLMSFVVRIFQLYLLWSLVYLPYDLYYIHQKTHSLSQTLFTYLRRFFVIGSHFHFWYLPSLIYCTVLVYFFIEVKKFRILLGVCMALYLVGALGDTYFGLLEADTLLYKNYAFFLYYFDATRTLVFFGAIFVGLGAILAWYQPRFSKSRLLWYLLICLTLYTAEAVILHYHRLPLEYNMYLLLVPLVTIFFLLLRKLYFTFLGPYARTLRTLSLGIYCSHALFMVICYRVLEKLQIDANRYNTLFFIAVLTCSLAFYWLVGRSSNRWLQRLVW